MLWNQRPNGQPNAALTQSPPLAYCPMSTLLQQKNTKTEKQNGLSRQGTESTVRVGPVAPGSHPKTSILLANTRSAQNAPIKPAPCAAAKPTTERTVHKTPVFKRRSISQRLRAGRDATAATPSSSTMLVADI